MTFKEASIWLTDKQKTNKSSTCLWKVTTSAGNVKKKRKKRKNNILSDTMAYSVHSLDGWQRRKIFTGEEAIEGWAVTCEGWGLEWWEREVGVGYTNITQPQWSKQCTIHKGLRATSYRLFHHSRGKPSRALSVKNKQKRGGDGCTSVRQSFAFHEAFVALSRCLSQSWELCGVSNGLLLGEGERSSRAGEARVGVHGLVGRLLRVGVLRQERDGRVGWSGLGLGKVFRVADALVTHVFSRVQQLFWTPATVLWGDDKRRERRQYCRVTGFSLSQEGWLNPKWSVITSVHHSAEQSSASEPQRALLSGLLSRHYKQYLAMSQFNSSSLLINNIQTQI